MDEAYEVIIAGAGPVGLGAAIELGQRGVRCALVDAETTPHRIPKGQSLTNRTLEHFHFWNCEAPLRAARLLPRDFPIGGITTYRRLGDPYWYYHGGGGPGRGAAVGQLYFRPPERLPQYLTEAVLRARVAELPNVDLLQGWRVIEAQDDGAGVSVSIEPVVGGEARRLSAAYLVGADGARSTVRQLAGITSTTRRLGDRMVLLVFRSPQFEALVAPYPTTTTLRIIKPELKGLWQFFGRVDQRDTWFFHSPVTADATLEPGPMVALMNEAVGAAIEAEVRHANFWELRNSVADQYRRGRIFIAGDACHSHPPYGGFGLNSGLEDARNLGWKLAAALQGWGGEALLESYDAERRPIFAQTADRVIAGGIERERAFLEAFSPETDEAAFKAAWAEIPPKSEIAPYMPHYAGSPIVAGGDGSPGIDGEATRLAAPGRHLAPARLDDGRDLYETLGPGFHLLALDRPEAADAFEAAAEALGIPLAVTRDSGSHALETYGQRLVLVRPDQFIAWTGDAPPTDIEALLRTVAGLG